MDLWFTSNKVRGTLPDKYRDFTLKEISRDLGVGFHSVVPDFRDFIDKKSEAVQGLGIYDLNSNPYSMVLDSIDFDYEKNSQGLTRTVFNTPYGKLTSETLYSSKMRSDGASLGRTVKHIAGGESDLKALGYIFENIAVEDNHKRFKDFRDYTGKDGVCVAFSMLSASPMHHIMKELMPFEAFVYQLHDDIKGLEGLADSIGIFFEKVLDVTLKSESDIVFLGANYDSFLTWPTFFNKYITPYLKKYSDLAHSNNKFILTHADGENDGLIQEYLDANIDIADSICPHPMTKLHLDDIRNIFGDKITVWGGLPSICVLEESMNDNEFERYIDSFFRDLGEGRHIILSFADTTPPDAKFQRIERVAEMAGQFKP
jgi:hypothetical protein